METAAAVRVFIGVVQANQNKGGVDKYRPILIHAGFTQVTFVARGKSVGHFIDQDGSSTDETFPLNHNSGLIAMSVKGKEALATSWLDSMWGYIRDKSGQMTSEELAEKVQQFVEASVPLKPIVLTEFGETVREYPPNERGIYAVHARDDHPFQSNPGVHDVCKGWVDLQTVSPSHNALVCRRCQLRAVIPNSIETYGELRAHFQEFNS